MDLVDLKSEVNKRVCERIVSHILPMMEKRHANYKHYKTCHCNVCNLRTSREISIKYLQIPDTLQISNDDLNAIERLNSGNYKSLIRSKIKKHFDSKIEECVLY